MRGLLLGLLMGLPLFAGCTRDTAGYCDNDRMCVDPAAPVCKLPDHQCTAGVRTQPCKAATASKDCADGQMCQLPDGTCVAAAIRGELSGNQQVPPTASPGDGTLLLRLSPDSTSFTYSLIHTIKGVLSAHIHRAQPGDTGAIVFTLKADSGSTDTLPIAADQVTELLSGAYYVDLHTSFFKEGEVRGQIFAIKPDKPVTLKLTGLLAGVEETPPNGSMQKGTAEFIFDEASGEITYNISHNLLGSDPVTGIHLHHGRFNFNGPHIVDLPTSPTTMISGKLTRAMVKSDQVGVYAILLKSGLTYLNYHTSMFTGGEMRAELATDGSLCFNVAMNGAQEVPAKVSSALQGTASFYLNGAKTQLAWYLSYPQEAMGEVTGAHIHKGAVGSSGPILCTLGTAQNGDQGYCPVKQTDDGTGGVVLADLLGKGLYVNLHTKSNPDGEIRGQILVPGSF